MPSESPTPDFRVSALKQTKDYTGSEEEFPGETQRPQIGGGRRQEEDAEAGGEETTESPNHDEPRKQDTDDSSSRHDPRESWLHKRRTPGIGAGRHRSSWTQKTPRQPKKPPLRGGTERRQNRNCQKPWKTAADPGELNEGAATLQEKRGLSRYGVREKGNRAGGTEKGRKGITKGNGTGKHWEEGKAKGGDMTQGALGRKEDRRENEKEKNSEERYIRICEQRTDQKGKQENDKKGRKGQQGQEQNRPKREPGKNKGVKRKRQEKDT
ncbi:hypothetical protein NDU88_001778 [Pleurodeles waltl]|uniref:Uncharacterized protein n=1 Tax=Pleurodeles waltl TaxID=8319 RepID=A0AAV7VCW4_PLEWA|nr:hypothetical protein NDU88_001778 [Pleurodeles waltl]